MLRLRQLFFRVANIDSDALHALFPSLPCQFAHVVDLVGFVNDFEANECLDYVFECDKATPGSLAISPLALLKALRPLQWVKNGLVFLPFVFAVDVAWSTDDLGPVPALLLKLLLVAAGDGDRTRDIQLGKTTLD